jgi:hypothetical protein
LRDKYATQARAILGVDSTQAHGLLRKCTRNENHPDNLINLVETYFKMARNMGEKEYVGLLRNAVYSAEKAHEVKKTIEVLGFNWHNLKE